MRVLAGLMIQSDNLHSEVSDQGWRQLSAEVV